MKGSTAKKTYVSTGVKYLSPEWETERHKLGIGGSEAAAIAGLNPYSSAFTVYWDKVGKGEPMEVSEGMRQGTDLEEYVAKRFCEATGKKVRKCEYMLQSAEHPFMIADVDRFVVGENAILECKTSRNALNYSYEDANNIPAYQLVQCLHYMSVVGAEKAYLATLVFGKDFNIVEINASDYKDDIVSLVQIEKRFWEENVLKEIPPQPDGSERSTEIISEQFPSANEELPPVDLMGYSPQLHRLSELKKQIAELTNERTGIENTLKTALGEAPVGEYGDFRITWKNRESTRLDSKALKADMPDVYAKYAKTSSARTFLFTEKN